MSEAMSALPGAAYEGTATVREMGCIMTGVIMSGRTGAAFAAQIGSMNVNQEVDAYETLGLSPMEFLVLPRALAMILMAAGCVALSFAVITGLGDPLLIGDAQAVLSAGIFGAQP